MMANTVEIVKLSSAWRSKSPLVSGDELLSSAHLRLNYKPKYPIIQKRETHIRRIGRNFMTKLKVIKLSNMHLMINIKLLTSLYRWSINW